jgi:hypothetical protein
VTMDIKAAGHEAVHANNQRQSSRRSEGRWISRAIESSRPFRTHLTSVSPTGQDNDWVD